MKVQGPQGGRAHTQGSQIPGEMGFVLSCLLCGHLLARKPVFPGDFFDDSFLSTSRAVQTRRGQANSGVRYSRRGGSRASGGCSAPQAGQRPTAQSDLSTGSRRSEEQPPLKTTVHARCIRVKGHLVERDPLFFVELLHSPP